MPTRARRLARGLQAAKKWARSGSGIATVPVNSECLVVACHGHAANESLPFVHARRYDRLRVGTKRPDGPSFATIRKALSVGAEVVKVVTRYL